MFSFPTPAKLPAQTQQSQQQWKAVKDIDPEILVLTAAGIANGNDVYNTIIAGADATGSSSGVAKAKDRAAMVDEMISAVRRAWNERKNK